MANKDTKKNTPTVEDWNRLLVSEDVKYTLHREEVDVLTDFCLDALEADVQSEHTMDVYNLFRKFVTYLDYTAKLDESIKKTSINSKKKVSAKNKRKK